MKKKFLFLVFCWIATLYGDSHEVKGIYQFAYQPWYTGSLLSLDGENTPKNTWATQPYLFVTTNYGLYKDNFSLESTPNEVIVVPQNILYYGFTNFWDMEFTVQTFSRFFDSQSSTHIGDTLLLFGFQLMRETKKSPFVRFTVQESFPTGKFDKLDPRKKGTDLSGSGSFITSLGINTEKMHNWFYYHPIRLRYNIVVDIYSNVSVRGENFYGGAQDTKGIVKPGVSLFFLFSPEISLTQRWVVTADVIYIKTLKGSFSGNPGTLDDGSIAPIAIFQEDSFQLAPALEYNFSSKLGVIGGVWFTVFGRNSIAFASGVISLFATF